MRSHSLRPTSNYNNQPTIIFSELLDTDRVPCLTAAIGDSRPFGWQPLCRLCLHLCIYLLILLSTLPLIMLWVKTSSHLLFAFIGVSGGSLLGGGASESILATSDQWLPQCGCMCWQGIHPPQDPACLPSIHCIRKRSRPPFCW